MGNNSGPSTSVINYLTLLILEFRNCLTLNEWVKHYRIFLCHTWINEWLPKIFSMLKLWTNDILIKNRDIIFALFMTLMTIKALTKWSNWCGKCFYYVTCHWLVTFSLVFLFFTKYLCMMGAFCLQQLYWLN